ncbi:uncharacterized protein CLUP02_09144 [Colletotrichum lupini]|uniref:Uncharacterized protein n=1 Tax=Colletotrichum lupini TaxID=145971 RepID=A0A9Q8WHJ7_9PEZI|nr:uncharacterized protein CLUP02_09144 [Colletotrichum lupini]UQC83649.1 hypothetical protein CLUP02_09144 [Colletotrichum lupini]
MREKKDVTSIEDAGWGHLWMARKLEPLGNGFVRLRIPRTVIFLVFNEHRHSTPIRSWTNIGFQATFGLVLGEGAVGFLPKLFQPRFGAGQGQDSPHGNIFPEVLQVTALGRLNWWSLGESSRHGFTPHSIMGDEKTYFVFAGKRCPGGGDAFRSRPESGGLPRLDRLISLDFVHKPIDFQLTRVTLVDFGPINKKEPYFLLSAIASGPNFARNTKPQEENESSLYFTRHSLLSTEPEQPYNILLGALAGYTKRVST